MRNILCLLLVAALCVSCTIAQPVTKTVKLTWTAPGDDGSVGTAMVYEIRTSSTRDSLVNQWTDCWSWPGASTVVPQTAGTAEQVTFDLSVIVGDTLFFAIKAGDELLNWSPLSNIYAVVWEDQLPPAAIMNLVVLKL